MTPTETNAVTITVVNGVEGPSVYINDLRVAGPKPWGGGPVVYEWTGVKKAHLEEALATTEPA